MLFQGRFSFFIKGYSFLLVKFDALSSILLFILPDVAPAVLF